MIRALFLCAICAYAQAWEPPPAAAPYLPTIKAAESAYGLPDGLLARLLHEESSYRPSVIDGSTLSPKGAAGIAQFMPGTASELGVDPLNPELAIFAAAEYLAQLKKATGSWRGALAAYNWGIGRLSRHGIERAPEETRDFVQAIAEDVL